MQPHWSTLCALCGTLASTRLTRPSWQHSPDRTRNANNLKQFKICSEPTPWCWKRQHWTFDALFSLRFHPLLSGYLTSTAATLLSRPPSSLTYANCFSATKVHLVCHFMFFFFFPPVWLMFLHYFIPSIPSSTDQFILKYCSVYRNFRTIERTWI